MIIRKAKKEDVDDIYKLFLELAAVEDRSAKKVATFLHKMRTRKKSFVSGVKKSLLKDIRRRNSIYLVAEINDEMVGYALASVIPIKDDFFAIPKIGYFNSLCVKKKHQGKRIASALNKEIEAWFRKNECEHVYLEVFSTNVAHSIYENWGYKDTVHKMWKKL